MIYHKVKIILVSLTICSMLAMAGCGQNAAGSQEPTTLPQETEAPAPTDTATPIPDAGTEGTNASEEAWKSNLGTIDLSSLSVSGKGVAVDGTTIRITAGGDFTVTGTLENGKIVISTTERVKLRLSNASITCNNDSAIFVEQADKAFITASDGTTNTIISQGTEESAIYSKDDLEIKGYGTLTITSKQGHGIKASDDLNIENGILNITSAKDGIHINETCDISGGTITINAGTDGIDSEETLIIRGGTITITAGSDAYSALGEMNIDETKATITVH